MCGFLSDRWRVAPVLAAALVAALYLILDLRTGDLAAHLYRADLFDREGFTIWNGNWYGGHHTPAYSVLFPPLAHYLTPQVAGASPRSRRPPVRAARRRSSASGRAGARCGSASRSAVTLFTGPPAVPLRRGRRPRGPARAAARPVALARCSRSRAHSRARWPACSWRSPALAYERPRARAAARPRG